MTTHAIDERTLCTLLAALRHYQSDIPRSAIAGDILDIATADDTIEALTETEIDTLCEDLNTLPLLLVKTAEISPTLTDHGDTQPSPPAQNPLHLADAIDTVLDLARQNLAPATAEFAPIRARQTEACNQLEDFAVNHLGDDDDAQTPAPANDVLAATAKLTIVCCLEALTGAWDKSDSGFITLIDATEDALLAAGYHLDPHNYAGTTDEELKGLRMHAGIQ